MPPVGDRAEELLARPQGRAEPADHGRAAGGACPNSRLYRELELARLANATPTAEQALREQLAEDRTAVRAWLRAWMLIGALLLALMARYLCRHRPLSGVAGLSVAPDPLAGLSPRDLQDKELGACPAPAANPADLDGLGGARPALSLSGRGTPTPCSPTSVLALQEGGASAATQAAQATVLYYQAGQRLTRGDCACWSARSSRTRVR